ncbi:cation acetate symporter [Paeniglutamicibacter cryotolerans]|uniref:Na+(H+)/acetate symporter ActP n=1 Tax=Paeniglutamicibacter cryotolerans TaxID=670079 RepID=A0A839QKI8_9MICC|nr:cation acetate symporter [Paeniglutamicibacter cryotolerans]MBB2996123.1 Na+(H+)/acetate symporter ActP [Paeniglutamicibacter cryotolerans]
MNSTISLIAIAVVSIATVIIAIHGLRISRTTGDFYVASRTVRPWWNASAIGGEYLSAASFLGIAGLIVVSGQDALWFPIGYTAGYLMLLLFVAAPLRRSGAYTLPDFAQIRLGSRTARRITSLLVVIVGWLYIVPQLHGAALTLGISSGLPGWMGSTLVMGIVCVTVLSGGMRSITFVQAFQYWLKLAALAIPTVFLLLFLGMEGQSPTAGGAAFDMPAPASADHGLYHNISLLIALLFGTLGLPHVLVRFYTNPDGPSARKTTAIVLGLLSIFYLFPTMLGILGRVYAPDLAAAGNADATVLLLPGRIVGGAAGDMLSALIIGGAFAAFLSTSSGLVVSLAGVISQDLFQGTVRGFRIATVLATAVPLLLALGTSTFALAGAIGSVFAFTASTICPLLLLGIWWRGLTPAGAIAGMVTGALACGCALIAAALLDPGIGTAYLLVSQPAGWSVPLAFLTTILVSLASRSSRHPGTDSVMARLHVPELS